MKMNGNTILISGGGSGIGKALAEMFHSKGNQVIIAGRRQEKLDEVTKKNEGMRSLQLDITNSSSIDSLISELQNSYPKLNMVVHNAGIMKREVIGDEDVLTAKDIIATNLIGQIELNSKLLPIIQHNNPGMIMTVSSGLAFLPRADFPTYCATKAAIHSYTQSLRTQLKLHNIQVIELEPPYVQTELVSVEQASDPRALPLKDFINELTAQLESDDDIREIQVERVKFQRAAESSGEYDVRYKEFNKRFGIEA
jgi:uncharacterized oxidoreductase